VATPRLVAAAAAVATPRLVAVAVTQRPAVELLRRPAAS